MTSNVKKMAIWYSSRFGKIILDENKIEKFVIPQVDKEQYLKINEKELRDALWLEEDEVLTVEDVERYQEQIDYTNIKNYILAENFTDEYAKNNGYLLPSEHYYEPHRAYSYLTSNGWEYEIEDIYDEATVIKYLTITDDYVLLDEETETNSLQTGGIGLHQHLYKVIEYDGETQTTPLYIVVLYSQWQFEQPKVMYEGNLDGLKDYLTSINRNLDEYLKLIKQL